MLPPEVEKATQALSKYVCVVHFKELANVFDRSGLFTVAALFWGGQIKHVGVCGEVWAPARDSFSAGIFNIGERSAQTGAHTHKYNPVTVWLQFFFGQKPGT